MAPSPSPKKQKTASHEGDPTKTPAATTAACGAVAAASGAGAAASGAGDADKHAASESKTKQVVLMINPSQPFRPKVPDMDEIISGRAPSVRSYAQNLYRYVSWKFSVFLHDDEVVQLRHPLYASRCPGIEDPSKTAASGACWRPTSVMEPMDMAHCIWSLTDSHFYEGTVSIWNLDPFRTSAFETELNLKDPSWLQYLVLLGHWSPGNLASSHGDEAKQRYFFPGTVLSFLKDTAFLEEKQARGQTIRDMPASGGHAVCWSFYAAIDEALEAGDVRRLRLLWEVSNQVTIRLRLNPTEHQLVLDRLALADQLRLKMLGAGVQSFFEMCVDILCLPQTADPKISCARFVALLKEYGVTYKGKAIDKAMGHAMISCMAFALDPKSRTAVRLLERVDPKAFDDHTKVMRCCQRIKSSSSPGEHLDMFVFAVECMAVSLLAGDTKDSSAFTVDNLAGKAKGEPGLMQTAVVKSKLLSWFFDFLSSKISAASGASRAVTAEGYQKLRGACASPFGFFQRFARARIAAEQETCSLRILTKESLETFANELQGSAEKAALDFLTVLLAFDGDGEAKDLAASGRTFSSYFEGEEEVEDEEGSLALHVAFQTFKQNLAEAPVGAEAKDSDDEPFVAIQGSEESEAKSKIYQLVVSRRREMQKFYYFRNWDKKPWTDDAEASAIYQSSKFARTVQADAGKQNKLMMFIPELYQSKEAFSSATSFKDAVVWRAEMGEVLQWMLARSDAATIVAATDARSTKIRLKLQTIVFDVQKDEQKHLENHIMYKGIPRKDDIRFPSRKVYGALSNVETVLGVLPVARVRMQTRTRSNFSACGEKNTHTRSYSGVPWRSLSSLPRMAIDVKDGVTGITSPVYEELVAKETRTRGHPLFWKETLDVEWFLAFFRDAHAKHIFDASPGSGAAACAAAILDIPYEGIAMSSKHAAWLDNIMDKAIFAAVRLREIPTDAKGKPDPEAKAFQDQVMAFFKDLVEEGRKYVERECREEEDDIVEVDGDDDDDMS